MKANTKKTEVPAYLKEQVKKAQANVFTKPSVVAALKASVKRNDVGFTAEEMQAAWGYEHRCSAQRRLAKLLAAGVFRVAGTEAFIDTIGRHIRRIVYEVTPVEAPRMAAAKKKKK